MEVFHFRIQKQFISNVEIIFRVDLTALGRDQVPLLLQIWARGTVLHGGHKWIEILSEGAFFISRLHLLKTDAHRFIPNAN